RIPRRRRGMFGIDTALVVTRVTYRLLKTFKDPSFTEAAVRGILPDVDSLSSQLELINQVGHQEGVGHGLITEQAAKELERAWRDRVRQASAAILAGERNLFRVLLYTKKNAEASEQALRVPEEPDVTLQVLR